MLDDPPWATPLAPGVDVADSVRTLVDLALPHTSADAAVRAVAAWTQLFGIISFELFGQFHQVIDDVTPVFERALLEMGRMVGLPPPWSDTHGVAAPSGGSEGRPVRRRGRGVVPGLTAASRRLVR